MTVLEINGIRMWADRLIRRVRIVHTSDTSAAWRQAGQRLVDVCDDLDSGDADYMPDPAQAAEAAATLARMAAARTGPAVTCPASRHAAMISEALMSGAPYAMLAEAPEHCGASIADTVAALWEARVEVEQLRADNDRLRKAAGVVSAVLQSERARLGGQPFTGNWSIPQIGFRGTVDDALDMADAALAQKGGE